ncbi:MAG: hypothetical protein BWY83_02348 [bacterium ADurb.Bin478]|nr:MAG: hypothetical protein BWY83_02348 [bacterium ADurb.Bin478]
MLLTEVFQPYRFNPSSVVALVRLVSPGAPYCPLGL